MGHCQYSPLTRSAPLLTPSTERVPEDIQVGCYQLTHPSVCVQFNRSFHFSSMRDRPSPFAVSEVYTSSGLSTIEANSQTLEIQGIDPLISKTWIRSSLQRPLAAGMRPSSPHGWVHGVSRRKQPEAATTPIQLQLAIR